MICWKCHKETNIEKPVRGDECPCCHVDLHVCRACEFYESGAHNDCRETSAEYVTDKERRNFCDYFRLSQSLSLLKSDAEAGQAGKSKADAARNAFNALFS